MKLYDYVEKDRHKLFKRFAKLGINEIENMDYKTYMQSTLWKKIREWVLDRDKNECQVCHNPANEVHHRRYDWDVMEGESDDGLISLCKPCHKKIEYKSRDVKVYSMAEKEERLSSFSKIHEDLVSDGLSFNISRIKGGHGKRVDISYCGDERFLRFYSFDIMMFNFIYHFGHINRGEVTYARPFGLGKFYQKSGHKIFDVESNKEVLRINMYDRNSIVIKETKHCTYNIVSCFSEYLSNKESIGGRYGKYKFHLNEV